MENQARRFALCAEFGAGQYRLMFLAPQQEERLVRRAQLLPAPAIGMWFEELADGKYQQLVDGLPEHIEVAVNGAIGAEYCLKIRLPIFFPKSFGGLFSQKGPDFLCSRPFDTISGDVHFAPDEHFERQPVYWAFVSLRSFNAPNDEELAKWAIVAKEDVLGRTDENTREKLKPVQSVEKAIGMAQNLTEKACQLQNKESTSSRETSFKFQRIDSTKSEEKQPKRALVVCWHNMGNSAVFVKWEGRRFVNCVKAKIEEEAVEEANWYWVEFEDLCGDYVKIQAIEEADLHAKPFQTEVRDGVVQFHVPMRKIDTGEVVSFTNGMKVEVPANRWADALSKSPFEWCSLRKVDSEFVFVVDARDGDDGTQQAVNAPLDGHKRTQSVDNRAHSLTPIGAARIGHDVPSLRRQSFSAQSVPSNLRMNNGQTEQNQNKSQANAIPSAPPTNSNTAWKSPDSWEPEQPYSLANQRNTKFDDFMQIDGDFQATPSPPPNLEFSPEDFSRPISGGEDAEVDFKAASSPVRKSSFFENIQSWQAAPLIPADSNPNPPTTSAATNLVNAGGFGGGRRRSQAKWEKSANPSLAQDQDEAMPSEPFLAPATPPRVETEAEQSAENEEMAKRFGSPPTPAKVEWRREAAEAENAMPAGAPPTLKAWQRAQRGASSSSSYRSPANRRVENRRNSDIPVEENPVEEVVEKIEKVENERPKQTTGKWTKTEHQDLTSSEDSDADAEDESDTDQDDNENVNAEEVHENNAEEAQIEENYAEQNEETQIEQPNIEALQTTFSKLFVGHDVQVDWVKLVEEDEKIKKAAMDKLFEGHEEKRDWIKLMEEEEKRKMQIQPEEANEDEAKQTNEKTEVDDYETNGEDENLDPANASCEANENCVKDNGKMKPFGGNATENPKSPIQAMDERGMEYVSPLSPFASRNSCRTYSRSSYRYRRPSSRQSCHSTHLMTQRLVMNVPRLFHGKLIGTGGHYVKSLFNEFGVRLIVPSEFSDDCEEVELFGSDMERLEQCKTRVIEYVQQLQAEQYQNGNVEIPLELWPFMEAAQMLTRLRERFSQLHIAQPKRSWLEGRQEEICYFVVRGPSETVDQLKADLAEMQQNYYTTTVPIPTDDSMHAPHEFVKFLIGTKRSKLHVLESLYPNVKITFPASCEAPLIRLEGLNRVQVENVKRSLLAGIAQLKGILPVPKSLIPMLLRNGTQMLKEMQRKFHKCTVHFNTYKERLELRGAENDVEEARMEIEAFIEKMMNMKEHLLNIPFKYQEQLQRHTTAFRKEFGVKLQFSQQPCDQLLLVGPSHAALNDARREIYEILPAEAREFDEFGQADWEGSSTNDSQQHEEDGDSAGEWNLESSFDISKDSEEQLDPADEVHEDYNGTSIVAEEPPQKVTRRLFMADMSSTLTNAFVNGMVRKHCVAIELPSGSEENVSFTGEQAQVDACIAEFKGKMREEREQATQPKTVPNAIPEERQQINPEAGKMRELATQPKTVPNAIPKGRQQSDPETRMRSPTQNPAPIRFRNGLHV